MQKQLLHALTMPGLHMHLPQSSQPPWEVIVPISQIKKLSHREGKSLIHIHAPSSGRSGFKPTL